MELTFNDQMAKSSGLSTAIVYDFMKCYIKENSDTVRKNFDYLTYTRIPETEIAVCLSFLSEKTVSKTIDKLRKADVFLVKESDNSYWYCIK